MKSKARRTADLVFCALFALLLLLPPLFINTVPGYRSEFDNRVYPDFPEGIGLKGFSAFEEYVNFRVGFRAQAVTAYQLLNSRLFSVFEYPRYMRGLDSHLFMDAPAYIRDYQRINVDADYLDRLVRYLKAFDALCAEQGRKFYFFLVPDKQKIYPEYFPRGYNVADAPSRTEVFLQKLQDSGLSFLYPADAFIARKPMQRLYNVEYDAVHWNNHGRFYGNQLLTEKMKADFPGLRELKAADYRITDTLKTSLRASYYPIHEFVPLYEIRQTGALADETRFAGVKLLRDDLYHLHYRNETAATPLKLLVFGDSFMDSAEMYYLDNFCEVTFLHAENLPLFRSLVTEFDPDIVVLESVVILMDVTGRYGNKTIDNLDALKGEGD